MTTAFSLVRKALRREVPPRVLIWGLLNTLNRNLKTGNRRFEFERLYLEHADPWSYKTDEYEGDKYRRTLECVLKWRRGRKSALEIGCSVGVFSGMLSDNFMQCVAVDFSQEVLRIAKNTNVGKKNLRLARGNIRSVNLQSKFDVIVCAEVLYYVDNADVPRVARNLDNHLAEDGIIVSVSGNVAYLDCCEQELSRVIGIVHQEVVEDPRRPYRYIVFGRAPAQSGCERKRPT